MNISELARKLKIDINRFRDMLPEMGFDVGARAIQIDDRTAQRILADWRGLYKKWEWEKRRAAEAAAIGVAREEAKAEAREVKIPKFITVRDFSMKIATPVNILMKILMKNGILASLNDNIDFDAAAIIGDDLGWKVSLEEKPAEVNDGNNEQLATAIKANVSANWRPPVVVVMGHVDHGKTKILDAIRQTNIMEGEAGGITQHIGAYETEKNGKKITFIDTPGHEAFTAMRSRGAKIADIAILVVASDDGVQPQTREVIDIITAAKLPFVVAINKMDKPDANPEKVKRELAELNLIPEDWGGKTICVPVSAKTGDGIDKLLETILLVADMEAAKIVADAKGETMGSIIESHVDKNEGVLATILIQNGTLKVGDYLKLGDVLFGRVRAMKNWKGEDLREAPPSAPVRILGLKLAPEVGDILTTAESTKGLERNIKQNAAKRPVTMAYEKKAEEAGDKKILNIVLKTDVLGSAEAILGSFEQFRHPSVGIKILHTGLGNITEADVERAAVSHGVVYGFNVTEDSKMELAAREKNVTVECYRIIYDLLNSVQKHLEEMLSPEKIRTDIGKLKVLAIFKTEKSEQIIGGRVTTGKIALDAKFDIFRGNGKIDSGKMIELQSGKQTVKEAYEPSECGLKIKSDVKVEVDDILQFYSEESKEQKIEIVKYKA
jgi:translation initiation factor IF-2